MLGKPWGDANIFALHFDGTGGGHRRPVSRQKIKEFSVLTEMFTLGKLKKYGIMCSVYTIKGWQRSYPIRPSLTSMSVGRCP